LNAYVTGIGPSKRVVVWDTSIAHATPDEIAYIFAHEMGHYVLDHIYKTLGYIAALLLGAFWVGFHVSRWLLRRYGTAWGIASERDWAALGVYMLVLAVLTFVSEPLNSAYSRSQEHVADVYGQEAVHGVVADPQRVAVHSFQVLGETSLDDPTPHPWVEWWSYDHPAIWKRAAFAARYDPWAKGGRGEYFAK
jgi:Zn-dependent protease with chaperone function